MLPRVFLLTASFLCTLAAGLSGSFALVQQWLLLDILLVAAFFIAIPNTLYRKELVNAIIALPRAIQALLGAVLNIKSANKGFLHTPHSTSTISIPAGK